MARVIREASKFDQLIACAWWSARESDIAANIVRQPKQELTLSDRWYFERRSIRLKRQASSLFAQAAQIRLAA